MELDSNKERPWGKYKRLSRLYSDRLESLSGKYRRLVSVAENVYSCGEYLVFGKVDDDRYKLKQAYFCKDRFCALCQWRRVRKVSYQLKKTVEQALVENPSSRFLFLTLTIKSVDGEDLRDATQSLSKGFNKMVKWKRVKTNLLGFVRSTEVTVNRETMQYHPHLHLLLQVKSSYFNSKQNYITQDEWRSLWKKAMQLDYDPQVRISIIKSRNGHNSISSAVAEVGKYTVKPTDYLSTDVDSDVEIIETMRFQMKGLRMMSYGLGLKTIYKRLFKNEEVDDDLIHVDKATSAIKSTADEIVARWESDVSNYVVITERSKL